MAYSKNKPYQRTAYRGAVDPSYDRYLKDAVNAGKAENIKESELEKPYNVKTYSEMQQNYDPPLPPVIDPGPGTGGLNCYWTSTDCEQLIGCWAGSDIVLEGAEAATAGYLPTTVLEGDIVSETISGSEDRALELVLDSSVRRNNLVVRFKDALGVIHEYPMDISCSQPNIWQGYDSGLACLTDRKGACVTSDTNVHVTMRVNGVGLVHVTWDGTTYSSETIYATGSVSSLWLDGSGYLHVVSFALNIGTFEYEILYHTNATGSWVTSVAYSDPSYPTDFDIFLDSSGYVHIVSVIYDTKIIHATNASGGWLDEDITTVTLTRYIDTCSSTILSDNTIIIAYTYHEYAPLDVLDAVKYISGTWGSWSASTDIVTDAIYDNPVIFVTQDTVKHIMLARSTGELKDYYSSGGWSSNSVTSTLLRYPTVAIKGNEISVVSRRQVGLTYIPFEDYYISSWSEPEAVWYDVAGTFGARQATLIYDQYRDALHYFFRNSSNNLGHAIRYL